MIGQTLSHYRVVPKIGAGSMGEVYLAALSTYSITTVYAGLREKEQAFQFLQKANDEPNTEKVFLKVDPHLPLRDDPRSYELVKRTGIPQ